MTTLSTNVAHAGMRSRRQVPSNHNPVVPRTHAPLRTLVIAMSVMCFLSTLAVGTLLLIERAVDRWTSQISGEATVQILPGEGIDADAEAQNAKALLEAFPGIATVRLLDAADAADLLEPWLGRTSILDELPIPRLLAITIDRSNPPDFAELDKQLAANIKGASLDTHRRWQDELTTMAATLKWLSLTVLLIISGAAIALVVYATRTALEANRETIEVLYLVGAEDKFIAGQIERRFLRAGLRAGLIGMAGGLAVFALFIVTSLVGTPSGIETEIRNLLLSTDHKSISGYALFLLVPVLATLISLMTARLATTRILKALF
jgi:cell division transport system permease protein